MKLGVALKEWAAVCRALAEGRQSILLRKGGISEPGGAFRVEHDRFWLWPTYVHQQRAGLVPEALLLLEAAEVERPPEGRVRIQHFAEVQGVEQLTDLEQALALAGQHIWSAETVTARFHYRTPGLFVLRVKVWQATAAVELVETVEQAGCKSWVELEAALEDLGRVELR